GALIMLAIVLAGQQLEGNVLQPFLMGKAVELHPLAVFLGVAAGARVAGIAGALFSIPLIAFVNATLLYVVGRDPSPELGEDEAGAEHVAALAGRRPASGDTGGARTRPARPARPRPGAAPPPRAAARRPGAAGAPLAAGDVPESARAAGQDRESAAAGAPPSAAAPAAEATAPGDAPGEEGAS